MSYLYVCEQGASIGLADNRFQIKCRDGMVKSIPAEALEVIEVFGKVQITTQCIEECLKRGVNILYYSTNGAYYGRLISTNHVNVQRQRLQAERTKTYVRQWSAEKLKGTDILQTLEQAFHGTFKGKEVYSVHLMYLIDATSVDVAVKDKVRYLREIEERVRNDAAHDIISVTDKTIEQKTGFKPAKIMQMIRELFNYTGMRVKKEYWDSYDYMNQSIVDRMA